MPVRTGYAGTALAGDVYTAANHARMPGGWLGYAQVVAVQAIAGPETALTGLSVTVTVGTSRRIRVTGSGTVSQATAAGTRVFGALQADGVGVGRWAEHYFEAADWEEHAEGSVILTPAAGARTYRMMLFSLDTAGAPIGSRLEANAARPAWILVEDLGPAA